MFNLFSANKLNYNKKGQIFPFLILIICIVLILAMVTTNLGKLSLNKTDVINAADAGALAAAGVLSGTLLGYGLRGAALCGYCVATIIWMIIDAVLRNFAALIATYICYIVFAYTQYLMAIEDGAMGWTNAKMAAMQYAFSNSGVDEERPEFNEFLNRIGVNQDNLTSKQVACYYEAYYKTDNPSGECEIEVGSLGDLKEKVRKYGRSGFSKFTEDKDGGYWKDSFGKVAPRERSKQRIKNGYGWDDEGLGCNSYEDSCSKGKAWRNYDNWVEVEVKGERKYNIVPFCWLAMDPIFQCLRQSLQDAYESNAPFYLEWLDISGDSPIGEWTLDTYLWFLDEDSMEFLHWILPMGFEFRDGTSGNPDEAQAAWDLQTDDNPVLVKVTKGKKNKDLGLWNFRYKTVSAEQGGVAYQEHRGSIDSAETIRPMCMYNLFCDAFDVIGVATDCCSAAGFGPSFGKTERHLFETGYWPREKVWLENK